MNATGLAPTDPHLRFWRLEDNKFVIDLVEINLLKYLMFIFFVLLLIISLIERF